MSEELNFGTCCYCETPENVRNVVMFDLAAPIAGHGWGCFQCNLPNDGASAVLCDECLEKLNGNENLKPKFLCCGYPGIDGRIEFEKVTEKFEHNMSLHPEAENGVVTQNISSEESEEVIWLGKNEHGYFFGIYREGGLWQGFARGEEKDSMIFFFGFQVEDKKQAEKMTVAYAFYPENGYGGISLWTNEYLLKFDVQSARAKDFLCEEGHPFCDGNCEFLN